MNNLIARATNVVNAVVAPCDCSEKFSNSHESDCNVELLRQLENAVSEAKESRP